jgi:hypothetical protein
VAGESRYEFFDPGSCLCESVRAMRKRRSIDYRLRAERLQRAIEKETDGLRRQRLENAASTYLTIAELIGWGQSSDAQTSGADARTAPPAAPRPSQLSRVAPRDGEGNSRRRP